MGPADGSPEIACQSQLGIIFEISITAYKFGIEVDL